MRLDWVSGFPVPSQLAARTLASLPVRVPRVESLLPASFGFASRLRLAVCYGYPHRSRLAPFIQQDSAHAGHTGADDRFCRLRCSGTGRPRTMMARPTVEPIPGHYTSNADDKTDRLPQCAQHG